MPTANLQVSRSSPDAGSIKPRKKISSERFLPPLILVPSMAAIITFVYIFILITIWVSLSRWGTLRIDWRLREPLFEAYAQMFAMPRWHADLRNVFIFTTLFLSASIGFGLLLRSFAGSPLARIHPLPKYFSVSLRVVLHRDRDRLALDFQPGDRDQSSVRWIGY